MAEQSRKISRVLPSVTQTLKHINLKNLNYTRSAFEHTFQQIEKKMQGKLDDIPSKIVFVHIIFIQNIVIVYSLLCGSSSKHK